jgi:YD repeat-containing protein
MDSNTNEPIKRKLKFRKIMPFFLLVLLAVPAIIASKYSQDIRNWAKNTTATIQQTNKTKSVIDMKPLEEKSADISLNNSSDTLVSAKNEKLQVKIKKGVLDKNNSANKKIALKIIPKRKDDHIVDFSLDIESSTNTDSKIPEGIPFASNIPETEKSVDLTLSLDEFGAIYAPSTLSFTYRNPKTGNWDKLPTIYDETNNLIAATVNHFSDFGVTGDKAQVFSPTLKNWETSLYTGSATYSYPISLLPGKGGFAPSFTADYSSHRANGTFDDQKGSWLGVGWDMMVPEIRFDSYEEGIANRGYSCESHLGTRLGGPQYSLILGGVEEPIMWIGDGSDATGNFGKFISKTTNMEIRGYYGIYKSNSTVGTTCRNKIIIKWIVKDTSGTLYTFEINEDKNPNRKVKSVFIPSKYMITKMVDTYGNTVEFENQAPSWEKEADGHIFSAYPYRVWYNDRKTMVQFTLAQKEVVPTIKSTDKSNEKNFEKSRLTRVEVYPDMVATPANIYKTYRFIYYPKTTYNFDTLKKIVEYAAGTAPQDTADPDGSMGVSNKYVTGEFTYENKPVGIKSAATEGNNGCRAGTTVNSWDKLASFARGEGEFGGDCWKDITKKLKDAGFGNCGGDRILYNPLPDPNKTNKVAGIPSCPESAEGEAVSGEAVIVVYWQKNTAPFLTKVTNGYGGEVYYTYSNMHKGKWGMNRNAVSSKRTSDANFKTSGTPDVSINYEYHPIVGTGQKINKGGGFGRVSQNDPVTGMSTTTTFYPLAPNEGDGGTLDPNVDPYFGSPLRTVVHKNDGTSDKVYSDTFYTYSFIPPYAPDFGLTDDLLNTAKPRVDTWKNYKIIDNILNEGFGKKITVAVDSFSPVKTNFITVPMDAIKPQFIPNATRLDKNQFLHTQQRNFYDRYGYQIKSASLGDVNDGTNGFNITDGNADLSVGRTAKTGETDLHYINPWWMDSNKFTYGLPFTPVLFTDTIKAVSSDGELMKDGDYDWNDGACNDRDVCCYGSDKRWGVACNRDVCANMGEHGNRQLFDQCKKFDRNPIVNEPPFSGTPGSLTKYSYTKYVRTADFLAKNMSGLPLESFVSDQNLDVYSVNNDYISNLTVLDTGNASDWSFRTNLQTGNLQYGDRTFAFSSVPALVAGANWIKTANDSRDFTQTPLVTFKVNTNTTIYIAHGDNITSKPSWLSDFTDTGVNLINNESNPKTFSLYSKYFSQGSTVSLGTNGGSGNAMYTIIAKAESTPAFTATKESTNKWKLSQNSYNEKGRVISSKVIETSGNKESSTPSEMSSSMVYDEVGNAISQTDARGTTSYTDYYNNTDKPYYKVLPIAQRQSFTNSEGTVINLTTTTSYNENWQPVKNIDPNGLESAVSYDCLGRLQNVYKGDAVSGKIQYSAATCDRSGNCSITAIPSQTYYYYDYQGDNCGLGVKGNLPHLRTKTRISSSASDNEYVYTDQISDGLGNAKQSIALKTKVNGADKAIVTETWYNNRGLKDWSSQPMEISAITLTGDINPIPAYKTLTLTSADKTQFSYDELGRTIQVTDPLGQQTATAYNGTQTTVTDANNVNKTNAVTTSTLVDGWGRKIKSWTVNLPDSANPTYGLVSYPTYDLLDNVTVMTNKKCTNAACTASEELLESSSSLFDHLGRKWKVTDPDLGTWTFTYDANGNITSQTDAKGNIITFAYDPINRMIKKTYPGNARGGLTTARDYVLNNYDTLTIGGTNSIACPSGSSNSYLGKIVMTLDTSGESSSCYDKRGRVIKDRKAVERSLRNQVGQDTAENQYEYFESDTLKATTLPTGERIEQKINNVGQLIGIKGDTEYLKENDPPIYNKFGSMVKSRIGNGLQALNAYDPIGRLQRLCIGTDCETGTNKLMDYNFPNRDKVGNILSINNNVAGTSAFNLNFTYDNTYQLKNTSGKYTTAYSYDPMGNMTAKTEGTDTVNMQYTDTGHKHAPKTVNGFTYKYDANGNLTEDESRTYLWDYDNKPVRIVMKNDGSYSEFAYDGNGNRVLKKDYQTPANTITLTPTRAPTNIPTATPTIILTSTITPTRFPTPTAPLLSPTYTPVPTKLPTSAPTPILCPASCPAGVPSRNKGNANCDSVIDNADFTIWLNEYNTASTNLIYRTADFDCNTSPATQKVSLNDYQIWAETVSTPLPSAGPSVTPKIVFTPTPTKKLIVVPTTVMFSCSSAGGKCTSKTYCMSNAGTSQGTLDCSTGLICCVTRILL